MNQAQRIIDNEEAWDTGELGADEKFVEVAPKPEVSIDDSLGLQAISIRLERSLIDDFKMIAQLNGLGYQPLMRQALKRFADCEKKRVLRDLVAQRNEEGLTERGDDHTPAPEKQRKVA